MDENLNLSNLVPRASPLPAPWNEGAGRGETLGTRLESQTLAVTRNNLKIHYIVCSPCKFHLKSSS